MGIPIPDCMEKWGVYDGLERVCSVIVEPGTPWLSIYRDLQRAGFSGDLRLSSKADPGLIRRPPSCPRPLRYFR